MVIAYALMLALAASPSSQGKEEFEKASELFRLEHYTEALPYFEKAYELSGKRAPTILALAQCERALKRYDEAIQHYREYLATTPRPKDSVAVEETVRALEKKRKESPPASVPGDETPALDAAPDAQKDVAPPPESPPPAPTAEPAPLEEAKPEPALEAKPEAPKAAAEASTPVAPAAESHTSIAKMAVISAGGATVATGIVFAILAATSKGQVSDLIMMKAPADDVSSTADTGFARALTADILIGVGVIAALVGLFMVD
jgi:tetratricopeptide (TPR) repeat protein